MTYCGTGQIVRMTLGRAAIMCMWASSAMIVGITGTAAAAAVAPWEGLLESRQDAYLADLEKLVAFPSVSADPTHAPDILAAAHWLRDRLLRAGMQHAAVLNTSGPHPIVYAHWFTGGHATSPTTSDTLAAAIAAAADAHARADPDVPTFIIYGHYDVQPVDPVELWASAPFEVSRRDGYLYGRGVDDDKGALLQAVHAVEALLDPAAGGPAPRVNIKFLLEGQEEVMSPDLGGFLETVAGTPLLTAHAVLSADGGQPSATRGGIALGLRGVLGAQIDVVTAGTDMHSGVRGGSVPNACAVLAHLIASLHDPATSAVAVRGFYDGVPASLEPEDAADIAAYPFDAPGEAAALGLVGWCGEAGYSPLQQRWHRPTLEVVGMSCGFNGEGIKTVIPATARAKLSARLVGDQVPSAVYDALVAHVAAHAPSAYARVNVTRLGGTSRPWTSPRDLPSNVVAARVSEELHRGTPPLYLRDGATIPALAMLAERAGLQTTKWGWGLGEGIHAPNERMSEQQWVRGREAWARLLLQLGDSLRAADFAAWEAAHASTRPAAEKVHKPARPVHDGEL